MCYEISAAQRTRSRGGARPALLDKSATLANCRCVASLVCPGGNARRGLTYLGGRIRSALPTPHGASWRALDADRPCPPPARSGHAEKPRAAPTGAFFAEVGETRAQRYGVGGRTGLLAEHPRWTHRPLCLLPQEAGTFCLYHGCFPPSFLLQAPAGVSLGRPLVSLLGAHWCLSWAPALLYFWSRQRDLHQ